MTNILVIGASSAIAQAFIKDASTRSSTTNIVAISRHTIDLADELPNVTAMQCDYSQADIARCADRLRDEAGTFSHVVICNGILHGKDEDDLFPEKTLSDLTEAHLSRVIHANAIVPALWIAALLPIVKGKTPCTIAAFSARVGSIGDNRLGGWYSYRASKSALNMLMKTASIEYARRAKNVKLIGFHPGTTDTTLSKPFQANVPPEKLFTPEFVTQQLRHVMDSAEIDGELSYKDWNNDDIVW